MRQGEFVRFVIDIEVIDMETFTRVASECAAVSKDEPGTLVYDWYVDEANGRARLYEAYASEEAVEAHASGPVFTSVGLPLVDACKFVHMDAFGDVGAMAERDMFWPTTFWGAPFASGSNDAPS